MIEVLVAMVLLSVGMLALTGLQLSSLKATNQSRGITRIAFHAEEIADRMRANPPPLGGSYAAYMVNNLSTLPSVPSVDCTAGPCTHAEMAAFDIYTWIFNLLGAVGQVDATITPELNGIGLVIKVAWDQSRDPATSLATTAANCSVQVTADNVSQRGPNCYLMRFLP